MPAPVLIQTSLILVPFQSIRNRFKLNANKPLKPHRGLRQRSGSAARGRGCSGQPNGARGPCHPIPGLPGDRAKVEGVALGQRGPHEPLRSHHSGQLHGDRFIWGDHSKNTCGAPEPLWGCGHSRSPKCGFGGAAAHGTPAGSKDSAHLDEGRSTAAPWHRRLWFAFGTAPAQPGRGTSPTPDPSAEGYSRFRGTSLVPGGASPPLPACAPEKGLRGQCPPCRGAPGAGGGRVGPPFHQPGPSSRSHGDTYHSTSSESYLRSWRISLIASMVLISLRERMETINKAHMERIMWAASPSPRCL